MMVSILNIQSLLQYGYGQWEAVKMAIRRSPDFRFDYYLRSLSTDLIGKRCEQLMKAAEKEVEQLAKKYTPVNAAEENKDETIDDSLSRIKLPSFKAMKEIEKKQQEEANERERKQLESKVEDIESQMEEIQNRLNFLQKCSQQLEGTNRKTSHQHAEFPDELLAELANLVAISGSTGAMTITNEFMSEHGQICSKKVLCAKIEDIAKKERRREDGDVKPMWYILPEYMNLLSVKTIRTLRREKDSRMNKKSNGKKRKSEDVEENIEVDENTKGAVGPDGDIVDFPHYDGSEEPRECKKAFTLFCTGNRKEVKKSLDPSDRKDRVSSNVKPTLLFFHFYLKHLNSF